MCAANSSHYEGLSGDKIGGEITSIIAAAHELKAPLSLMRQLSLLLGENSNISERERIELTRQIRLSSEKALRLTSDLTKSARLEDAMFSLEPINPVELCKDIAAELKPLMDAHGRFICVSSRKKHPLLLIANRDLLRRIVTNFTDNALHYGNPDSSIEIAISTLNHGRTVRLSVRDFGPALKSELRRGIKQNEVAINRMSGRPESSGLGLYLAGKFADAMNGRIGAISHRDGATFYVELHASKQLSFL